MTTENWISLISGLLTTAATGVGWYWGPKIALKQSLKRFRAEQWWQKEQDAYDALMDHLAVVKKNAEGHLEAIEMDSGLDRSEESLQRVYRAYRELHNFAAKGAYLISEEAAAALTQFEQESWSDPNDDPHDHYSKAFSAAEKCIQKISSEAKKSHH